MSLDAGPTWVLPCVHSRPPPSYAAQRQEKNAAGPHLSKMAPTPALWALFRWTCSPVARRIPSLTAMDRWEKEAMSSSFQPGEGAHGQAAVSRPLSPPFPGPQSAPQTQPCVSQTHPLGKPRRGSQTQLCGTLTPRVFHRKWVPGNLCLGNASFFHSAHWHA